MRRKTSWKPVREFEKVQVLRALWDYRYLVIQHYPSVPIPSSDETPTPVAALVLLWEHWRLLTGRCPSCRGLVLGTSFGGMLSFGRIGGYCVDCAEHVVRETGSYGEFRRAVNSVFDGMPYRLWTRTEFPGGWNMEGPPEALIAVLQELGATELPARDAVEF